MIRLKLARYWVVALCAALVSQHAAAQFESRATFPFAGTVPYALAVGDFNRDGKLDVAVTTYLPTGSVTILLGNGDGTFRTGAVYSVAVQPYFLTAADLRHNGMLDLVVGDSLSNYVYVLLGNGDGTFQPAVAYATSGNPIVVSTGDFNGDGKLDIIATTSPGAECECIEVLPGNGDGTFGAAVTTPIPYGQDGGGIAAGYFNKDKKLDLATMGSFGSADQVDILLGNGDGSFTPELYYALPPIPPSAITVADFNGDKKPDLAVVSLGGNGVAVLLGNGDGTFQNPVFYYASSPMWIAARDMDGDGKVDLVTSGAGNFIPFVVGGATVFKGNGDGTFQDGIFYPVNDDAFTYVAVGDFNNDGKPDLVLVDNGGTLYSVITLLNTGTVTFSPTTPIAFANQLVGTTSHALSATMTNSGTTALTVSSVTSSGKPFHVQSTCKGSLAPGGNCTISATFSPQVQGVSSGLATIRDSASSKPQFIELTGNGTVVKLSPSQLNFPPQKAGTKSAPEDIHVTNTGSVPLDFTSIVAELTFGNFAESNDCLPSINPGASCIIRVIFSPRTTGLHTASVVITDSGGGSPQSVPLSGTGD